ncbi:MAG: XdhC family protein [Bacteroidales bacterium]|nr:XdhC family protein [Bacteroidales bacterium]
MLSVYSKIEEVAASNKKAALCIVIETSGSTPRKAGAKMIVLEDRNIIDTIGGGNVERIVVEDALTVMKTGNPAKIKYELHKDTDMTCGGVIEVYIEPISPQSHLILFGAGHVGSAVAKYAITLGFNITIIDDRQEVLDQIDLPSCEIICKNYSEAAREFEFREDSYIVITTPKHAFDEELTAYCAKQPHEYLGMIGSKKKVEKAKERFSKEFNLSKEEIDDIDMPIGIKFNAQSPEEIAISIVAKLIDVKNKTNE